jgi:hypothetical protein
MDFAVVESQLRDAVLGSSAINSASVLAKDVLQNIEQIRVKCAEFQNSDSSAGGRGGRPDLSSWRRGAGGGGGDARFKNDSFSKAQTKQAIITPIHTKSTPVSNTPGSWTAAAKKNNTDVQGTGASASASASASISAGAVASPPIQGLYKIPSQSKAGGFNKSKEEVESKILNNLVMSKLNKFTKENYESIKQFLEQILSNDETEFLKDFMILVFKKATREQLFCALYVKLIAELCEKHPVIKRELMSLYDTYLMEFEKVEEESMDDMNYDEFCDLQSEKLYRLGYGQFLGELTKKGILDAEALLRLYKKILDLISTYSAPGMNHRNQVEQMAACLSRITSVFKNEKNPALISICQTLNGECGPIMRDIVARGKKGELPGLSSKARFALMDSDDIFIETR